jgi:hypothetical protein
LSPRLAKQAPAARGWIHEVKHDLLELDGEDLRRTPIDVGHLRFVLRGPKPGYSWMNPDAKQMIRRFLTVLEARTD